MFFRPLTHILLIAAMVAATACSTDDTLDEERRVDLRQPMRFGLSSAQTQTETVVTRANLETTGRTTFKVGTWKAFGQATQQTVMDGYKVDYSSTAFTDYGDGYNWHYEGVNGQPLRYWDLEAYPYEFRAVSPYISGAAITAEGLTITTPFQAQTLTNGQYNVSAADSEPCVVANVSRTEQTHEGVTGYVDTDKMKGTEINDAGKANATREVHLPFHHIMSKVGFRLYIGTPMPSDPDSGDSYAAWIKSITITAQKTGGGGLVTAGGYAATNATGFGGGAFSVSPTTTTEEFTLLSHNLYTQDSHDLNNHTSMASALDLTADCLQQIPQEGVKIHVVMHIQTNHVRTSEQNFTYDSWLSLDPANTDGDTFTWEPEHKYIYYLQVPTLSKHELYLQTCEILPWDEVQTTDIGVGL
jgi:hypothetical protein